MVKRAVYGHKEVTKTTGGAPTECESYTGIHGQGGWKLHVHRAFLLRDFCPTKPSGSNTSSEQHPGT